MLSGTLQILSHSHPFGEVNYTKKGSKLKKKRDRSLKNWKLRHLTLLPFKEKRGFHHSKWFLMGQKSTARPKAHSRIQPYGWEEQSRQRWVVVPEQKKEILTCPRLGSTPIAVLRRLPTPDPLLHRRDLFAREEVLHISDNWPGCWTERANNPG